jgi:hypothetical protein
VLPSLVALCAALRDSEALCPTAAAEAAAAMAALRRGDIASAAACGMAAEPKGWRVVPAAFEQDEGADSFYSVSLDTVSTLVYPYVCLSVQRVKQR